ncbi:MAG: hypothetical protein OJF47_000786 [Nitrospira sp.]|nr:MAG: hypothetical protein OJF47_000786 [Nitrospira sp.]
MIQRHIRRSRRIMSNHKDFTPSAGEAERNQPIADIACQDDDGLRSLADRMLTRRGNEVEGQKRASR